MNSDGTGVTQLTTADSSDCPSVTNDGARVVYASHIAGITQVCIMNSDGSGKSQLTNEAIGSLRPCISGDGSKITFVRDTEVWIMNANGSNQTNLTGSGHSCSSSALNTDASKIVYTKGAGAFYHLFIMDADGGNEVDITPTGMDTFDPRFNVSGTKVVFWGHDTTLWDMQLVSVNLADNAKTSLPHGTENDRPCFTPNGQKVIFDSVEGGVRHLYITDGTTVSQLTNNAWNDYGATCSQ
jgi:Tol biopolymer transport system component